MPCEFTLENQTRAWERSARYWSAVEILYFPFYSYEEILCAFGDGPHQRNSMSASIERLASYLTGHPFAGGPLIDNGTRTRVLSAFAESAISEPAERSCLSVTAVRTALSLKDCMRTWSRLAYVAGLPHMTCQSERRYGRPFTRLFSRIAL